MTLLSQGARRTLWLVGIPVAALIVGRWLAGFVTDRLWESRVSEGAALVGTRFALLAGGLEVAGLVIAVAWFLLHFLWTTRAALLRFEDLPKSMAGVSDTTLYLVAAAAGLLIGIAVGGGTSSWLHPVLLAINGVQVGVADPLLQADLGLYLGDLPLWNLLFNRAVAMFLPAALGVVLLSVVSGTLTVRERRVSLDPRLRWQFALLLILAALLIGWRHALLPYRLAATKMAELGPAEFLLRTTVAQVMALFAAIAAVVTFLWGARVRFTVALAGWVGLGLALLGGAILVETRSSDSPLPASELVSLRRLDSIAFGLRTSLTEPPPSADVGASLWTGEALTQIAGSDSATVLAVAPGTVSQGDRSARSWFVVRRLPRAEPVLSVVSDERAGPTGGPSSLRPGDQSFTPGLLPYVALSRHHAMPNAPQFDLDAASAGVPLGGFARRVALGWALQFGPVLRATAGQRLAWRLDPVERLTAMASFVDWAPARAVVVNRDVYWVSDGLVTAAEFPASRTVRWQGGERGYVRAGFVGVVRARGAETHIYLRPDGDSLSATWSRIAAPLVEPPSAIPGPIMTQLGLPAPLALAQSEVLQGTGWTGRSMARDAGPTAGIGMPNAGTDADPYRTGLLNDNGSRVIGLFSAGLNRSQVQVVDSVHAALAPKELQAAWERFPFFQMLRDSIKAAGADYQAGPIRYALLGDTVVAYQPNFALGPGERSGLVLVNLALGAQLGSGRSWDAAWQNLRGVQAPAPVGGDPVARMEEARQWLERADAALKRGDLEEFGKAFSYLRALLAPGAPSPSR